MKKETSQSADAPLIQNELSPDAPGKNSLNRRKFVETVAVSALGFTILPRHVLGGKNLLLPAIKLHWPI